jgi:ABC-type amino acid transport substrate-binding protein
MRFLIRRSLTLLMAMLLLTKASLAVAEPDDPIIEVATLENWPYGIDEGNSSGKGAGIDFLAELGRRSHLDLRQHVLPMARLVHDMNAGQVKLSLMTDVPAFSEAFFLGPEIFQYDLSIFSQLNSTTTRDLDQSSIAILPVGRGYETLQRISHASFVTVNTEVQSVKMLLAGRVGAIAGDRTNFLRIFKIMDRPPPATIIDVESFAVRLQIHKSLPEATRQKLISTTLTMLQEGRWQHYVDDYILAEVGKKSAP